MPTIRITDDQHDRIETLRAELSENQAGPYASVNTDDVLAYLLDLGDEVDDPERRADLGEPEGATEDSGVTRPAFPRDQLEQQLDARNRKHGDGEADEMDLYTIAAEYDIAGRSNMTKAELVDAVLEEAERLYADPFHPVDIEFSSADPDTDDPAVEDGDPETQETEGDETGEEPDETGEEPDETGEEPDEAGARVGEEDGQDDPDRRDETGGADQLTATLSLLETHDDKWWQADGDARYEVQLPDESVQTARTKDDVRAVLFKNY